MLLKYLMTISLSMGFLLPGFSQYSVKGLVSDKTDNSLILNCTFVIRKLNSLQKQEGLSADGRFELKGLSAGRFSLLLTRLGYADYSAEFELSLKKPVFDFGRIGLVPKVNLLKEVTILAALQPIRIKGDTTEYNALAFRSNANDKVENLLKQLPGISVDKDGKLSAQGRSIDKILVDGTEFFGDDPTLATRNIRTDMVDKIQIFEKKSELAALRGINDGKGIRTLNIKLKANKKKGYFGKTEAGMGTDGYYGAQLMGNYFEGQQRLSVYGVAGNNGATSLNWQDNAKYASSNVDISVPGYMIDLGGYDELESRSGNYEGKGIPVARTSGLHYEHKWNKNENSIQFNYKIGSLKSTGEQEIRSQNSLPTGLLNTLSGQEFANEVFRQKLDGLVNFKLDSSANLKITMNAGIKNRVSSSSDFSIVQDGLAHSAALQEDLFGLDKGAAGRSDLTAIRLGSVGISEGLAVSFVPDAYAGVRTENLRYSMEKSNVQQFMGSVLYLKKLKKQGRTFTAGLSSSLEKHQLDGALQSNTRISQSGLADRNEPSEQDKTSTISNRALYLKLSYSEPLAKSILLSFNYGFGGSDHQISRFSFDRLLSNNENTPDPLYSSDFELRQFGQEAGLNFNLVKEKVLLNFGSNGSAVAFKQRDRLFDSQSDRRFLLWHPQLNFQYTLSPQGNIRFNYEGNTAAPGIAKLQPVWINDDPLNISQGNPFLKPSFSHRFFVGYQSYQASNGQLIGVFANYGSVSMPIINKIQTDTAGRTFTQFINLRDHQSSSLNLSLFYDRRVKALDMSVGLNFNLNGNTSYHVSNEVLNRLEDYTYKLQMRFSKLVPNVYEFNLSFGPTYRLSGSSLQPNYRNDGKGFLGDGNFSLYLPLRFQITAAGTYQYLGKTAVFNDGLSRMMLNAAISKVFLKENALKISLSGSDLLNQNVGFNRSITGNLITQQSFTVIKRYFMLAIAYDFNKMKAQ